MPFLQKIESRFISNKSLLCLGLDPCLDDIVEFCKTQNYKPTQNDNIVTQLICYCQYLINETKEFLLCVKPNLAFFIQFGFEGIKALKDIVEWISGDIPVILDCKFGDISNTMNHYVKFTFDYIKADAVTVNMYMGLDVLKSAVTSSIANKPYNSVFILASTSNPSADVIQSAAVGNDKLFLHIIQEGDRFSSCKLITQ